MKAFITIQTCQEIEGEKDTIELTALGSYEYSPERCVLEYDEPADNGYDGSHINLEIFGDQKLDMVRTGGSASELIIEQGKTHYSQYATPYGTLNICINAECIKNSLDEAGGRVRAQYTLNFNALSIGRFDLTLTVKPVDEPT